MKSYFLFLVLVFNTVVFATTEELHFNTQEFSPFNYSSKGKVSGPITEIIKQVCKRLDISCKFRVLEWKMAQTEVKKGLAHGLFVVGKNKKREKWLRFSIPILTTQYGFFVLNSNKNSFKNIADIQGYNVGVYGPSNTSHSLVEINNYLIKHKYNPIKIRILHEDTIVFKQLNSKIRNLDAVYSNMDVGNDLISKLKLKNIKYMGQHRELNYYIAFSKKKVSAELVEKFNTILHEMYDDKSFGAILEKYNLRNSLIK